MNKFTRINKYNWKEFLLNVLMRALRTFFQALGGMIAYGAILSDIDWKMALSASAMATIVSVVMSFATGLPEVTPILEPTDETNEEEE